MIDYIITKSISRFARNTLECLQYVRKLKEMNIFIFFEKEKIDSANAASEMLLSILAAVAQEESRSISENLKWGYRKRFEIGEPKWVTTYGFQKIEGREYIIHEEQAKGVKRIFELYEAGNSLPDICCILEREQIPAMCGGKWWPKSLAAVLHNEKYVGDVMMQKSYVVDHLSHKKIKNDQTVVPSYYVRDHHEAIISRKTFDRVQAVLAMKDRHLGSVQYPYYGTLYCPICGEKMIRYSLPTRGFKAAWTCGRKSGDEAACPSFAIKEKYIDCAVREAYKLLDKEQLDQLSKGCDAKTANAANAALDWMRKQPRLQTIEYVILNELVENITFSKWSEAVIKWKFGLSSQVSIRYEKASEIPAVEIERTDEGYKANGEIVHCAERVIKCVDRVNMSSQMLQILDTGSEYRPCIFTQNSSVKIEKKDNL